MIATISMEPSNWEESLSTCKFSQRVALIKNSVTVNTFVEDKVVIKQLREENYKIKSELNELRLEKNQISELEESHFKTCLEVLKILLKSDKDCGAILKSFEFSGKWGDYKERVLNQVANEPLMVIACFNMFRKIINEKNKLLKIRDENKINEIHKSSNFEDNNSIKKMEKENDMIKNQKNDSHQEVKKNNFLLEQKENKIQTHSLNNNEKENKNFSNFPKTVEKVNKKKEMKINLEEIEITDDIKHNKDKCLKVFKNSKKYVKRFQGLEEDKSLLLEKIEKGKLGSEVQFKPLNM